MSTSIFKLSTNSGTEDIVHTFVFRVNCLTLSIFALLAIWNLSTDALNWSTPIRPFLT